MQQLLTQITEPLVAIVVTTLTVLSAWVGKTIQAKVQNEVVRGTMQRLHDAVSNAVHDVGGPLIDDYRKAAADGVVTADEVKALKAEAVSLVKLYLGDNGTEALQRIVGADKLEELVFSMVKAELQKLKAGAS